MSRATKERVFWALMAALGLFLIAMFTASYFERPAPLQPETVKRKPMPKKPS